MRLDESWEHIHAAVPERSMPCSMQCRQLARKQGYQLIYTNLGHLQICVQSFCTTYIGYDSALFTLRLQQVRSKCFINFKIFFTLDTTKTGPKSKIFFTLDTTKTGPKSKMESRTYCILTVAIFLVFVNTQANAAAVRIVHRPNPSLPYGG